MKTHLNFMDISSWQAGLDLDTVYKKNPDLDGVIVKATGGTQGVQKTCDPWVQWLIKHGKPWGFYHYLNDDNVGASGRQEAEFFVENCINYFGVGMPFLDYEGTALRMGTDYLLEALNRVYEMTGVKAGIYCSLSVLSEQDFSMIAAEGYPLWVAQYADMAKKYDFNSTPWQRGSISPFSKITLHQYACTGHLEGYNYNLDIDRFYGTEEDWRKMLLPVPANSDAEGLAVSVNADLVTVVKGMIEYEQSEIERRQLHIQQLENQLSILQR